MSLVLMPFDMPHKISNYSSTVTVCISYLYQDITTSYENKKGVMWLWPCPLWGNLSRTG